MRGLPILLIWIAAACGCSAESLDGQGKKIFMGNVPVIGRLQGHEDPLPPQIARCVSCHARSQRNSGENFAPPLTRTWLTEPHPRRGGPAYAYDRQGFCATVRDGVDPGFVLLMRSMPRFNLNDRECRALWTYLTGPNNEK